MDANEPAGQARHELIPAAHTCRQMCCCSIKRCKVEASTYQHWRRTSQSRSSSAQSSLKGTWSPSCTAPATWCWDRSSQPRRSNTELLARSDSSMFCRRTGLDSASCSEDKSCLPGRSSTRSSEHCFRMFQVYKKLESTSSLNRRKILQGRLPRSHYHPDNSCRPGKVTLQVLQDNSFRLGTATG